MTRSEEELRVGTTERESGRVRLQKYVVEEEVTKTVPVRREEVRVEREPITDANRGDAVDGPAISEEEHEVVLHEEEAVVEKRAVPKERIRLEKDVATDEETVSETVRKEQVDVDGDRRPPLAADAGASSRSALRRAALRGRRRAAATLPRRREPARRGGARRQGASSKRKALKDPEAATAAARRRTRRRGGRRRDPEGPGEAQAPQPREVAGRTRRPGRGRVRRHQRRAAGAPA